MKTARFILKIVALSLALAAAACAVVAFWDKLYCAVTCTTDKIRRNTVASSEYDDYEE